MIPRRMVKECGGFTPLRRMAVRTIFLTGVAAALIAGYGLYDYTRVAPTVAQAAANAPEGLAKEPPAEAKVPIEAAKAPSNLGTLID